MPSLDKLKKIAEELKGTGARELKKEEVIQKEEIPLSDLTQERLKLEKILQEINNLKGKTCQRIGLIKTIERRKEELNQQLAFARKENDSSDQIKKRFEILKEDIK